ncbi:unnamed protein product, partial [Adineta steineri]
MFGMSNDPPRKLLFLATGNSDGNINETLLIWPKALKKNYEHLPITLFVTYSDLIDYVYRNLGGGHPFDLHIPGEYLKGILEDPVSKSCQIHIYPYYDNIDNLNYDKNRFQFKHKRLQFCLESDLEKQLQNIEARVAASPWGSIGSEALNNLAMAWGERLRSKQSNPSHYDSLMPEKFHSTAQSDSGMKNMEEIDPRFICGS